MIWSDVFLQYLYIKEIAALASVPVGIVSLILYIHFRKKG